MSYHRNFHFLQGPAPQERLGRYVADDAILIGAPVQVLANSTVDANGQLPLVLATSATAPIKTRHGILIWENPTADYPGQDPVLTRSSDIALCPDGASVQLVSGLNTRVRYTNTEADDFRGSRTYPGRIMIAGLTIATPTVKEGDFLTPGPGNDTAGYWQETGSAANAWLVVSAVNSDGSLDAQFLF